MIVEEEHNQKQEQIKKKHLGHRHDLGGENLGILLYLPQKS